MVISDIRIENSNYDDGVYITSLNFLGVPLISVFCNSLNMNHSLMAYCNYLTLCDDSIVFSNLVEIVKVY